MSAIVFGFNPPWIGVGTQNVMSRQEDERLIKNDILQLLYTVPGERVMRATFGVHLLDFVFEQGSDSDIVALESEISTKIALYDPRVIVDSVTIEKDLDNNALDVRIVVRMRKDPLRDIVIEQSIKQRA